MHECKIVRFIYKYLVAYCDWTGLLFQRICNTAIFIFHAYKIHPVLTSSPRITAISMNFVFRDFGGNSSPLGFVGILPTPTIIGFWHLRIQTLFTIGKLEVI